MCKVAELARYNKVFSILYVIETLIKLYSCAMNMCFWMKVAPHTKRNLP